MRGSGARPSRRGRERGRTGIAYTEFTLWLTPCEPLRSTLRAIIDRLAHTWDAAPFDPHVTVFCGASSEARAREVVGEIARRHSPIELTPMRLEHTESYTKTLFVAFDRSEAVERLFEAARAYSDQSDYLVSPHLSLLYQSLPETRRAELCRTVEVPMSPYRFDRLRLIETELPIEAPGPVLRWRVVADEALRGP